MVTPPTFVNEGETLWNVNTTPKTASLTLSLNDVVVACSIAEDAAANTLPTPNHTDSLANTWTTRGGDNTGSHVEIVSDTMVAAAGKTGADTISCTNTAGSPGNWGSNSLQFSGSDGVGAVPAAVLGTGSASMTITTTQDNSAVVVFIGDWAAVATAHTWLTVNGTAPSAGNGFEKTYLNVGTNYTVYGAYYPDVGAAGVKTVGLSAPAGMTYSIIAIEVKGSAAGQSTPIYAHWDQIPPGFLSPATFAQRQQPGVDAANPDATITPVTVNVVVAIDAPAATSVASPATVNAVVTIPQPAATSVASPATVNVVVTIPAPAATSVASPATVAVSVSIPVPLIVIRPATVSASVAIPVSDIVIRPATVSAAVSIPAPSMSMAAGPATVAAAVSIPAPTVVVPTVSPATVNSSVAIHTPYFPPMQLQAVSYSAGSAGTSHTVSFSATTAHSALLVVASAPAVWNSPPTGWRLLVHDPGGSDIAVFAKTAVGGETSATFTLPSSQFAVLRFYEYLYAEPTLVDSAAAAYDHLTGVLPTLGSESVPTLDFVVVGAAGTDNTGSAITYTDGFSLDVTQSISGGASSDIYQSIGVRNLVVDGTSVAPTTNAFRNGRALVFALKASLNLFTTVAPAVVNASVAIAKPTVFSTKVRWTGFDGIPTVGGTTTDSPIVLGVAFDIGSTSVITGVRWYLDANSGDTSSAFAFGLWTNPGASAGTLVYSETGLTYTTVLGWNELTFATPQTVSAGAYKIGILHPTGAVHFSFSSHYFSATDPPARGPIDVGNDLTPYFNGRFDYGTSLVEPLTQFNETNYWHDVVVTNNNSPDATITPATVNGPVSIGAPTVIAETKALPAVVSAVTSIAAPTVIAETKVSPATVNSVVAIATPLLPIKPATVNSVTAIAAALMTITPATVNASVAIATPAISAGSTISASTVNIVLAIPTALVVIKPATVNASVTIATPLIVIQPATVSASVAIPTPVVSASGNTTTTPSTVNISVAIPAPIMSSTVNAVTVAIAVSIPAPTVIAETKVSPSVVSAVTTIPIPLLPIRVSTVSSTVVIGALVTVAPATVTASVSIPGFTVIIDSTITPTTVSVATTIPAPSISAAGNVTVAVSTVNAVLAIPVPVMHTGSVVTPATVSATTNIFTPLLPIRTATVSALVAIPNGVVPVPATVAPATLLATLTIPDPIPFAQGSVTIRMSTINFFTQVYGPYVFWTPKNKKPSTVASVVADRDLLSATPSRSVVSNVPNPTE